MRALADRVLQDVDKVLKMGLGQEKWGNESVGNARFQRLQGRKRLRSPHVF
jgi:hypothetical protein